jgi:hypothetical protein
MVPGCGARVSLRDWAQQAKLAPWMSRQFLQPMVIRSSSVKLILELGKGFAFVGSQYHLDVAGQDFYLDLLFYHLRLRCFVVFDLKIEDFKPEFAGKMNFYLSAVDDRLRHPEDQLSINLPSCLRYKLWRSTKLASPNLSVVSLLWSTKNADTLRMIWRQADFESASNHRPKGSSSLDSPDRVPLRRQEISDARAAHC